MKSSLFKTVALLFITTVSFASTEIKGIKTEAKNSIDIQVESQALYSRLVEINTLAKDKDDDLTKEEKKGLRKEVKQIKTRLAEIGGGVYISAGGLILILILLIILL